MDAAEEGDDGPAVLFKKRGPKKSTIRKRAPTPPADDASDASEYSTDDESGRRVKRRRKMGGVVVNNRTNTDARGPADVSATSKYAADRSATIAPSDDATRQTNWYEEAAAQSMDAKQLLGTTRETMRAPAPTVRYDASAVTKQKDEAAANKKGPIKTPANIRTITITDYSPDVCKDYKQTGFCGFGDSCKFLHAREDYAQGWQLDREWENVAKGKKHMAGTVVASRNGVPDKDAEEDAQEAKLLEGIPFACIICKQPYKNPIITRCNHYFCEACALRRFKKTPACAQCGAGTGGVFNGAKNLQRLLEKKREREAKIKAKARENGEEVSDDNDDGDAVTEEKRNGSK